MKEIEIKIVVTEKSSPSIFARAVLGPGRTLTQIPYVLPFDNHSCTCDCSDVEN
jgi:hypothetical protein